MRVSSNILGVMSLLLFLFLLLGTSAGSGTRHRKFLFSDIIDTTGMDELCPYPKPFHPISTAGGTIVNRLRLRDAALVQKVVIDTKRCDDDRVLIEGNFTVHYVDASDIIKQERLYSDNLVGHWDILGSKIEITLDPVLYTDHLSLSASVPVQCSRISIYGCTPEEICRQNTCKNNGICIGNGLCSCQKGFMGSQCESPVSEMQFDDYDFVGTLPNVLLTKDAAFDMSGDVTFVAEQPDIETRNMRSSHHGHHGHHGSSHHSVSFHGHGGSCHYSSSHSSGYSHSGHTTYGHHPSNSAHGCVFSHSSGYSHTAHVSYGHNHNHGSTHYMYTTHGTSHHSHGASLHYSNNQLCMHVHNSHHHGHHYQVVAPFNPKPGHSYSICSSYSPHHGACIYINGKPAASQTKPTGTTAAPLLPVAQKPLCFGSCGAPSGGGLHNYTISNKCMAGGSVPFLANNWLLGLLGAAMSNLLHLGTSTLAPTPTTQKHGRFTNAPTTTTPPPSATTVHGNVVTSKYGPVCYDCIHVSSTSTCSTKMQCNKDDTCLVFRDKYGYTQRCISKQDCQKGLATSSADCWHCCDGNLCNQNCTQVSSPSASCQDDLQCFSLSSMGAFYNVCADPVYSSSICKKTCGKCP